MSWAKAAINPMARDFCLVAAIYLRTATFSKCSEKQMTWEKKDGIYKFCLHHSLMRENDIRFILRSYFCNFKQNKNCSMEKLTEATNSFLLQVKESVEVKKEKGWITHERKCGIISHKDSIKATGRQLVLNLLQINRKPEQYTVRCGDDQ